ncbi:Stk1 family PASTA domain-containing Ser/Thr kinase [Streptomyces sp. AS02]|uniref:Stk1 family PASTA domain-containing Ser/Thr kinase n=1 Tax=Streptomyces sp. AS02 TaxID=2938946 RepID=UPI0020225943|nr:PASTA domain-containing protein [Streptomyces sp. AS02]MCL8009942.1 PASTA domain-containing protein [Streptomyces sp. AS02]
MNFGGPDDLAFSHPAPVAVLGDRYELRLLLGSGGMAEVHLAHDLRLDRGVAVKTPRTDLAHDPALQERFRREAQSAASLNHPAIAAVYDTGEHFSYGAQLPYLVMEYVDGTTLREALYSGPPLTVERALEVTAGVLEALAHSHQHGIVHRDIKPANVMLTWSGQVKVMDFGIARDVRDVGMTQTSMVIGTAQYLSPEQAMGHATDARSDLYSVGCLLYELLTLRTPFTGDSPMAVMYQHVQEEPRPPSLYHPEVGPRVDAIVLRALTKDPAYRYQSAQEMLAEVEAYLGAQTVLDRTSDGGDEEPDAGEPAESGRRRGNAVLIGVGAAVVVAALVLGWFMFGRGTADDGKADVPDLVGQTLEDARRTADNLGLTLTVTKKEPCTDQPKGHICEQTPVAGRIDKGEAVSVTVSTGAPKVEVPDVTDKDGEDASRILEDKGFKVKLRHKVSTEDAGTVLEQDPAGGESVEKGTEITLTVAKEAEKATVPDLTGSTLSEARRLLAEHDLELGDTTEVESSAEAGTVVGQSAASGDEVKPGSSVDVQIAKSVQTVQIPADIIGETLAEVQNELGDLGLQATVASGYSQASDAVVTSSTPAAGSEVEAGSTVVVVTEEAQDTPSDDGTPADDTATTPGATNGGR